MAKFEIVYHHDKYTLDDMLHQDKLHNRIIVTVDGVDDVSLMAIDATPYHYKIYSVTRISPPTDADGDEPEGDRQPCWGCGAYYCDGDCMEGHYD